MATLTQLLAEKAGISAPPVSKRGVTLKDLLAEKAAAQQPKQPGALSQAAGVAGEILAPKTQAIMEPINAAARGVQGVTDYFAPQPLAAPPGPEAGIGAQFQNVLQNAPRVTREYNRLLDPSTDISAMHPFVQGAIDLGRPSPITGPGSALSNVGAAGVRTVGRGVTGFLDAFNLLGRDIGVTGFEQAQKTGIPKQTAQMLDPFTSEPRDVIRRNPLLAPARGVLHAGSMGAQALGPLFGAADPAVQEAARAGKPLPTPDYKASLKQGAKDFKEFIRQTFIGAQARQRGERDIGAENQAKFAETTVPHIIAEMKRRGANTEQIKSEVQRQLFNIGFTGDASAAAGEIVAFEAALTPVRAAAGGLKAFGVARRAAEVEKKAALAQKALKKAPGKIVTKPSVSGAPTVEKPAVPIVKEALKPKPKPKPKPKTVKGKVKVDKVLAQRATNIEKRLTATGKADADVSRLIENARTKLTAGNVKGAEAELKSAITNVERVEASVRGKPFKLKTVPKKKPVTKIEPEVPVSKPGGPLSTGILRSRIEKLRKAGASPTQLDAAEAALSESLPRAEKLINAAEAGLKAPATTPKAAPKPKAAKPKPKAVKPKAPKKKAPKKTDAASDALEKKVKAKRKGLGKKGEAQLFPEGKSKKGKEILADLKAQAVAKAKRPKAFGPSKSQIEEAERSLRQLKSNIEKSGKSASEYIRSEGGSAADVNRLIPQLKKVEDIQPFAGKGELPSAKEYLQGTAKKRKVSLEEFGEEIVADFVEEIPKQIQKGGLRATTSYVRKIAMDDLKAARGLGTGGDLAMKSAIRKIKRGDILVAKDTADDLMLARQLYGSALNDVRAAAKVRAPLPVKPTPSPLPTPKTKAQLRAIRKSEIATVKAQDIERKAARQLYKKEVARLEAAKKTKNASGQKKLQAQIDKFKTGNPMNRGAIENAQGKIVPIQLSKIGGEGVVGGTRIGRLKVKPQKRKAFSPFQKNAAIRRAQTELADVSKPITLAEDSLTIRQGGKVFKTFPNAKAAEAALPKIRIAAEKRIKVLQKQIASLKATRGKIPFEGKPSKAELQVAVRGTPSLAPKPFSPKGFAQAPGAAKTPSPIFKPKPSPRGKPFLTKVEKVAAKKARREAGKRFIRERIEDREGLYGSEVEKLLRQPKNAKRLDKMMTQMRKARRAKDTERMEVLRNAINKLRGELQGQVKKQGQSARIRQLTKKMSDAFRRGNMEHYKNASDELERLIVKPKMKERYLSEAKALYDQQFSQKSFKELNRAISDRSNLGEEGFARFFHSKPLRDADAKAVGAAMQDALIKNLKKLTAQAKDRGQSLSDFLVKTKQMSPKEAKSLVSEANRVFKKSDQMSSIGSINVSRLKRQGNLSKEEVSFMRQVNEVSDDMMKKIPLTRGQVNAAAGDPNVIKLNDMLWHYTDQQLAAVPQQLFAQMQATLNEMVNSGASLSDSILAIRPMMKNVSRSQSLGGRWLQGFKDPASAGELMTSLKQHIKTATNPVDVAMGKAMLKTLEPMAPSNKLMAWRAYQEFSVNNVLSAGITQTRNIFGAGLEVLLRQPTDKITRAMLTSMTGGKIKNPAYWAEVLPEIGAIYGNFGKGIVTGARFFKYGSSRRLVDAMMSDIKAIRGQLLKHSKGSREFKALVTRRDKLWNQVRDVIEINAQSRTGEVFTGQQSTLRQLAARLENPILRGAADTTAKVVNMPVRALIASDAALTQMSFKGHKASMLIRKAIRKGMSVRDVGKLRFTAFERNQALQDSLYYLYRREWGQIAKAMHVDKLTHTPVIDNLFLFMRTRTNILKNYVDNSPFGLVNVINESIKSRGLDAKSFARFVNGTAIHLGLYQYAKSTGGRFVGPSKNKKERDLRRARSIPELYYEDKDGNIHDMSNIAPVTPIVGLTAAYMEAEARGKAGQPLSDNMVRAYDQFTKSVIEDAIYADVKGIQRMTERWAETSEDPTAYGSQALYTDLARFATGRGLPNILRETKQSGKILGIPIGLQPDRSVVEPTGNFAQTLEQQIASDIPGFTPANLRISPLTGNPVVRAKRYTPFNPKFWTEGITPGENIPENENRVVKELLRVKAGYSGPRGSIAKKYINIKLNNEEKRHFIKVISGAKYKGLSLLETLDTVVQDPGYKSLSNIQGGAVMQRETLQSVISQFTEIGYREAVTKAVDRLMKTDEGRRRLWFAGYQGNPDYPYTGDIDHLKLLLRINNIPIQ